MKKTIIIAEAGVNHNGDIQIAKKLIDAAASAGADYVKFQTFKADKLVSFNAKMADYQAANTKVSSQYEMLKQLELSDKMHLDLKQYAERMSIKFLSTGFDNESINYLSDLGIDFFKVPSGELTNLPYLINMARKGKPIVISTGMANLDEIKAAMKVFLDNGTEIEDITVLHCNTEYPTPFSDVNLLAMVDLKKILNVEVGYSDHTLGIEVPIAAVALGASVIEKHFTLDRTMEGPDHKASLEPQELKAMVSSIRNIELALGSNLKRPSKSEEKNIKIARKSIHLSKDVKKGKVISEVDVIMLRPGDGISPMELNIVVSKYASRDMAAGHKLSYDDLI